MNEKSMDELKEEFKTSIRFERSITETLKIGDEIKRRDSSIDLNDLRDKI